MAKERRAVWWGGVCLVSLDETEARSKEDGAGGRGSRAGLRSSTDDACVCGGGGGLIL